jgi:hypothetical protein
MLGLLLLLCSSNIMAITYQLYTHTTLENKNKFDVRVTRQGYTGNFYYTNVHQNVYQIKLNYRDYQFTIFVDRSMSQRR